MSFSRREWRAGRPGAGFEAQFGRPGAGWEGSSFRQGTEHEVKGQRQAVDYRGPSPPRGRGPTRPEMGLLTVASACQVET